MSASHSFSSRRPTHDSRYSRQYPRYSGGSCGMSFEELAKAAQESANLPGRPVSGELDLRVQQIRSSGSTSARVEATLARLGL